jgi:hypothetical protein
MGRAELLALAFAWEQRGIRAADGRLGMRLSTQEWEHCQNAANAFAVAAALRALAEQVQP